METKHRQTHDAWSRRPHFAPRQTLTADQLNAGFDDELLRQRLLNRALHGYGVVFGLVPSPGHRGCLEIECGLALDRHGRMLYWPGGAIGLREIVGDVPECPGVYTLFVHYAERLLPPDECAPCGTDHTRWTERTLVFSLRKGCCEVDCECPEHPEGTCIHHREYLCQRTTTTLGPLPQAPDLKWACDEPGPLCRSRCGGWSYDREAGIPIACVEVCDRNEGRGQEPHHGKHDTDKREPEHDCPPCLEFCDRPPRACAVRPLVYRSPLLYELIRCCDVDLPRVARVSWQTWLERGYGYTVPWSSFVSLITGAGPGFAIGFSKPIRIDTLHQASVTMTAFVQEQRSDYWIPQQVPLRAVQPLEVDGQLARAVRLVPEDDWLAAEVTGRRSTLSEGARFEITVRGQLLRDQCGQMLDARPLDIPTHARCQGRPGDDFTTVFRVAPDHECDDGDDKPAPHDHDPKGEYPPGQSAPDKTPHETE